MNESKKHKCTVLVYHADNTQNLKRKNGESWISYWKRKTQKEPPKNCPCCDLFVENDEQKYYVGAHVYKMMDMASPGRQKYIVPTCNDCNSQYSSKNHSESSKECFPVPQDHLVPANEDDD